MHLWVIPLLILLIPAFFWAVFAIVLMIGTGGIAGQYPAVEPCADSVEAFGWRPCRRVLVGKARMSGGMLEAAMDAFGVHIRPGAFARVFGGRAFSLPWSALGGGGVVHRTIKGVPVLETRLPTGQRFAADVWCFAGIDAGDGQADIGRAE